MTMIERCIVGGMELIDAAKREGLDVRFDSYPYDAWCGKAGSALFDDGFLETWAKNNTIEDLEAASGQFKGERLTPEKLAVMRREDPLSLIVCHVMDGEAVRDCIAHPDCMIASDALYTGGGAHPRIAGTFPKSLKTLRDKGYSWGEALKKMTVMPADSLGLASGKICAGSVADVSVFDKDNFIDHATYQDQFAPPTGVKLVVMGGHVILRDGNIEGEPRGDFYIRRA
jgi:N-acyl-D-amino-acid deacylase